MVDLSKSSAPQEPPQRHAPRQILVVDSTAAGPAFVAALDGHAGWSARLATNREESLDMIGQPNLHAVVLDVSEALPERGALYHEFIHTPSSQLTRLLLLATPATLKSAEQMIRRPMDRVALKPTAVGELVSRVQDLLEQAARQGLEAEVKLYHTRGDDPFPVRVRLQNISSTGMFVQTQQQLPVGERMRVSLRPLEFARPVQLMAVVRRKEQMGGDTGYGLQFQEVLDGDIDGLGQLLGAPVVAVNRPA